MSDENLVILEFKYLQKKKLKKQAVKSARIKKSHRIHWLFSFPSKIGDFQHLPCFCCIREALWMQVCLSGLRLERYFSHQPCSPFKHTCSWCDAYCTMNTEQTSKNIFMYICGCRFLYFFSQRDVRNKAIFLILEHFSLRGVKQKKHVNYVKHGFKPLLQENQLKNLTSRKVFWSSHI